MRGEGGGGWRGALVRGEGGGEGGGVGGDVDHQVPLEEGEEVRRFLSRRHQSQGLEKKMGNYSIFSSIAFLETVIYFMYIKDF